LDPRKWAIRASPVLATINAAHQKFLFKLALACYDGSLVSRLCLPWADELVPALIANRYGAWVTELDVEWSRGLNADTVAPHFTAAQLPQLTTLHLRRASDVDDAALGRLGGLGSQLVDFAVGAASFTGSGFAEWPAEMPQLRRLGLRACHALSDDGLATALARTPELASLTISDCAALTPKAVPNALSHVATSLVHLIANGCDAMLTGAADIAGLPPKLRTLDVSRCRWLDSDAIRAVARLEHVSDLRIVWLPHMRDDDVVHVCTALAVTLRRLDISNFAPGVSFWPALACMQNLRDLALANCPTVGATEVIAIVTTHCPGLRRIDVAGAKRIDLAAMRLIFAAVAEARGEERHSCRLSELIARPRGPTAETDQIVALARSARVQFSTFSARIG